MLPRPAPWLLILATVACAQAVSTTTEGPDPLVTRAPLEGLAVGSRADTLRALVVRRDSLDQHVTRLAQQRAEARQALVDMARNPSGDRLPNASNNSAGRGAMSDRFREETKAEMAASRLVEQEKVITAKLGAALGARDALCSELSARIEGADPRRCAAIDRPAY